MTRREKHVQTVGILIEFPRKLNFSSSNSSLSTNASVTDMMNDLQGNDFYENIEQNQNLPLSASSSSSDFSAASANSRPDLDPLVALQNAQNEFNSENLEEDVSINMSFNNDNPSPHLLSYDKLPADETPDNFSSKRQREKSDDSVTSRKFAKFSLENNLENMSILIKFPDDDSDLFSKIDEQWKNTESIENEYIHNGLFMKLGDLNKSSLMYMYL